MVNIKIGCLYIVSTPIGDFRDITLRALEVLREADAVICEEFRQGSTLLKKLGLPRRELLQLNEHNETEQAGEFIKMLLEGKNLALISDCGTPAFADPGTYLIGQAMEYQIPVKPIPGVSSLMTVISMSPKPLKEFYFAGFLPRRTELRKKKLNVLKKMQVPIILMDTPYRLNKLLDEVKAAFGNGRMITLGMDLTMPGEKIIHAPVGEVIRRIGSRKSEFMLIVH
jgi:16S rRNA (cytidine1402-2'-O)-methyltransferase